MLVQWTFKMCPFHIFLSKYIFGYRYTLSYEVQCNSVANAERGQKGYMSPPPPLPPPSQQLRQDSGPMKALATIHCSSSHHSFCR